MSQQQSVHLSRSMGLLALTLYGVGDMLGTGIYALIGSYAGAMGNAVWVAFAASMVAAMLTGLSYASLGSRYPRAAGAAYVTQHAFGLPMLSYVLGLAVLASGLTSMATATRGFSGYVMQLVQQPGDSPWVYVTMLGSIGVMTLINLRGIRESIWANSLCTIVEVSGLVLVIAAGMRYWGSVNLLETAIDAKSGQPMPLDLGLILSGAVLTFYSFVGFEDMLNVTEEVKDPQRTFPIALVSALIITTLIYIAVAVTAVSVIPAAELAKTPGPLVAVVQKAAPWVSPLLFTAVSLFAIANTALLNYIMGSRLLYGMSKQGLAPKVLGKVHPRWHTPHVAILVLLVILVALAMLGKIGDLAQATSLLLLAVFVVVNLALVVLQRRPNEPRGRFEIPWIVPVLGAVVCLALIGSRLHSAWQKHDWTAPLLAAGLIAGIVVMYLMVRPKAVDEAHLAALESDDAQ